MAPYGELERSPALGSGFQLRLTHDNDAGRLHVQAYYICLNLGRQHCSTVRCGELVHEILPFCGGTAPVSGPYRRHVADLIQGRGVSSAPSPTPLSATSRLAHQRFAEEQ